MKRAPTSTLAVASALALLSACNSLEVKSWMEPDFAGRQLGTCLVMGIASTDTARRRYEDHFVHELASAGVDAVAGYTVLPDGDKLDRQEIQDALKSSDIDSLILTRVVAEKEKVQFAPTYYSGYRGGYYGYYDHFYTLGMSSYAYNYTETEIESAIYDIPAERMVWVGQMSVTDFKSDKKNIKAVVAAQIEQWKELGMMGATEE